MDQWTVAVLGDGGVGKTALAVQVSPPESSDARDLTSPSSHSIASLVSRCGPQLVQFEVELEPSVLHRGMMVRAAISG